MPRLPAHRVVSFACMLAAICGGCGCDEKSSTRAGQGGSDVPGSKVVGVGGSGSATAPASVSVSRAADAALPPFAFAKDDEQLLDEVQRGCFNFFWKSWASDGPGAAASFAPDRSSQPSIASVAGIGFQLSAIVVGAERGWVTKEQARARSLAIVKLLASNPDNRKAGLFYHFLDSQTAAPAPGGYEHVVSTIDSAILLSGILTASAYFGGEVASVGDQLVRDANWKFFAPDDVPQADMSPSVVSLGWKPTDLKRPSGDGALLNYQWLDCGDEHRLVTFLAVAAPEASHALDPDAYYRLRRQLGQYKDTGPMNWFPWSGAMFVSFFAHCWIDYRAMGTDDPSLFAFAIRPRIDWWENARRTARLHQLKAIDNPKKFVGFGEQAWGLSASDVKKGYAVPGVFPEPMVTIGAVPHIDYPVPARPVTDDFGDGTLAPYAAGCAIMFDPQASLKALRHYRAVSKTPEFAAFWTDPAAGGFGFQDAFNATTGWVAPDVVAIDAGPLLMSIENARTGLLWRTFHQHPVVQEGARRLRMTVDPAIHGRMADAAGGGSVAPTNR